MGVDGLTSSISSTSQMVCESHFVVLQSPVYSSSFTYLQYGSTEGRVGGLGDLVMCMVSSRQKVDTWRAVSKSSKMILPLIVWLLEILCKLNK